MSVYRWVHGLHEVINSGLRRLPCTQDHPRNSAAVRNMSVTFEDTLQLMYDLHIIGCTIGSIGFIILYDMGIYRIYMGIVISIPFKSLADVYWFNPSVAPADQDMSSPSRSTRLRSQHQPT